MKVEEFAVFFENGAWLVLHQNEFGTVSLQETAPSLEQAIKAVAMMTEDRVGLKLITRRP